MRYVAASSGGEVRVAVDVDRLAQRDVPHDVAVDRAQLRADAAAERSLEAQLVTLRVQGVEHARRGFHLLEHRSG